MDWHLKRIGLVVFAVATAVGYFYSSAYYKSFGIKFLSYASPLDLLFAAVENMDKVVPAALIVPLAFLLLLIGVPVAFVTLVFAAVSLVVVLGWIVLAICAVVMHAFALPVAMVQACVLRIHWLRAALNDIRADKRERAKRAQTEAGQHSAQEARTKPLLFSTAYRSARDRGAPPWTSIDPQTYIDIASELLAQVSAVTKWGDSVLWAFGKQIGQAWKWIRDAYLQVNTTVAGPGTRKRRIIFQSWSKIHWLARLLVLGLISLFLAYLFYVAGRFGEVDAADIRQRASSEGHAKEKPGRTCYLGSVVRKDFGFFPICALMPFASHTDSDNDPTPIDNDPPSVFAVPTGSLSSVEFTNCTNKGLGQSKEGHLFGRANFHQDAVDDTRQGKPNCLVYLGATGSMQFFADFSGESKDRATDDQADARSTEPVAVVNNGDGSTSIPDPPPDPPQDAPSLSVIVDGRNGAVSAQKCKLELRAVVGPFKTGKSEEFDQDNKGKQCPVPGIPESASVALSEVGDAIDKITAESRPDELLVLVGRADIRPINNDDFGSNMELTQKRVSWVKGKLDERRPALRVSVLSIPGGPVDSSGKPEDSPGEPKDAKKRRDDPCSRVVEIYTCKRTLPAAPADAGAGQPQCEERSPSSGDGRT